MSDLTNPVPSRPVPPIGAEFAPHPWGAWPAAAVGAEGETVEVGAFVKRAARAWPMALAGLVGGLLLAALIIALVRPWYRGESTVLIRNANDPAGSILSRFGIAGDAASGLGGGLGSMLKSPLETEIQLLGSRDVLGQVVDSLGLQARVRTPWGVPARDLLVPRRYAGSFRRVTADFTRRSDGRYDVATGGTTRVVKPGGTVSLPVVGPVTLVTGRLPAAFTIQFEDREDAITRLEGQLNVKKSGGEVTLLRYSGPDSLTAAAVPNAIVAVYLERRRTTDRGLNQRRYEFLAAQADTVSGQLAAAEDALRRQQEGTGVLDPEVAGRTSLEAIRDVRQEFGTLDAERAAIRDLVNRVEQGRMSSRELAAFPSFLRAPAINSIIAQLTTLETERTRLLERRTPADPEVAALSKSITDLEQQLLPLGRTYAASLDRQTGALRDQTAQLQARLDALPSQAEGAIRGQRDVRRLSQTLLALQAQMIDARLAAISEGGQVRQVDAAFAPKRAVFPRAVPVLAGGAVLGVVVGLVIGGMRGSARDRIRTVDDATRGLGVPGTLLVPGRALLLTRDLRRGTLVVVGAGAEGTPAARAVGRHLAKQTLAPTNGAVAALGLSTADGDEAPLTAPLIADGARPRVLILEAIDAPGASVALDVADAVVIAARAGLVRLDELRDARAAVERVGVPCVGVVLVDAEAVRGATGPASASAVADSARRNGRSHEVPV